MIEECVLQEMQQTSHQYQHHHYNLKEKEEEEKEGGRCICQHLESATQHLLMTEDLKSHLGAVDSPDHS